MVTKFALPQCHPCEAPHFSCICRNGSKSTNAKAHINLSILFQIKISDYHNAVVPDTVVQEPNVVQYMCKNFSYGNALKFKVRILLAKEGKVVIASIFQYIYM